MEEMTIGEFARCSHLSPKALRLYDELGVLVPARVDGASGYRFYTADQLEQARLVSGLRQLQIPLTEIKAALSSDPTVAAVRIAEHWKEIEEEHAHRRQLATHLIDRLQGRKPTMYEVSTTEMPSRKLLCLERTVSGWDAAWALGKEFMGILRAHPLPVVEGRPGATFCIYWGEVSEDSDGPLEWCRPVPPEQAEALAASVPELRLREEPAHTEAFVHLGLGGQIDPAQWQLVAESLQTWASDQEAPPSDLGMRMIYRWEVPVTADSRPDCDFAVPLTR